MKKIARVVLDNNIDKSLDYLIPDNFLSSIQIGMRVEVPLKNMKQKGYVVSLEKNSAYDKLKSIHRIVSKEELPSDLLKLGLWISRYYCCSLSKTFRTMISTSIRKEIKQKTTSFFSLGMTKTQILKLLTHIQKKSPLQAKVLELLLKAKKGLFSQDIVKQLGISTSPLKTLVNKKMLKEKKVFLDSAEEIYKNIFFQTAPKTLHPEQKNAYNKIIHSIDTNHFDVHLIHGITGSGKTEIYLQAIQHALDKGKSALMLVPEVALTSQTIERFRSRFKEPIAVIHHKKSQGERFTSWQAIKRKEIKIVLGARSAIFSPMQELGIIIIDEEHDTSYKQTEEAPCYHARHIAVMRGKLSHCPIILASATPSLESYTKAKKKQYNLSTLTKRATQATLAKVKIIDMRLEKEKNKRFTHFSQELLEKIEDRYKKGEQTLLFLNRRGYHHFTFCLSCSEVIKCPHCDVSLTYHKQNNILLCHACLYSSPTPRQCPSCKKDDQMKYKGFGTEHVQKSLHAIFPNIRTLRLDRDTTSQKHSHETLFKQFRSGKADVLIGTQMIVKGLHFPSVTLVGVLNTDGALNIPDFRSSEYVFQLLTQVAGRAGREDIPGEVLIQTYLPNNEIIQKAKKQDYVAFYNSEVTSRDYFSYPPFSHIIKFLFSSSNEKKLVSIAQNYREKLIALLPKECQIHPLIACGRAKLKDRFRFFFLIRTKNIFSVNNQIELMKKTFSFPSSTNLLIDTDPIYTYF